MATQFSNNDGTTALQSIREGMTVLDASGDEVGTVDYVQLADAEAVTTEADRGGDGLQTEPGLPLVDLMGDGEDADVTERMKQTGYIRIDAKGLFSGKKTVGAENIANVHEDHVHLSVGKGDI